VAQPLEGCLVQVEAVQRPDLDGLVLRRRDRVIWPAVRVEQQPERPRLHVAVLLGHAWRGHVLPHKVEPRLEEVFVLLAPPDAHFLVVQVRVEARAALVAAVVDAAVERPAAVAVGRKVVVVAVVGPLRGWVGEVTRALAELEVPHVALRVDRRIIVAYVAHPVVVLFPAIGGAATLPPTLEGRVCKVRVLGIDGNDGRDVCAAPDAVLAQAAEHALGVREVALARVNGKGAVAALHVDVNVHAVKRNAGLAVLCRVVLDEILRLVAVAALVVAQNVARPQPGAADEARVQLDDLANVVAGHEDALEAVEARGNRQPVAVRLAEVEGHVRVVVDEAGHLSHVSRVGVDLDPVRLRVVERLGVLERAAVVDVVVAHVVKVEVVHERLVLVQGAAALLAKAEVLCRLRLVDVDDGRVTLVEQTALLGLPDNGIAAARSGGYLVLGVKLESRMLQCGKESGSAGRGDIADCRDAERVALNPQLDDLVLLARSGDHDRLQEVVARVHRLEVNLPLDALGLVKDVDELRQAVLDNGAPAYSQYMVRLYSQVVKERNSRVKVRVLLGRKVRRKAQPPDTRAHKLHQQKRAIVEAEDLAVLCTGRVDAALAISLVLGMVLDAFWLLGLRLWLVQITIKVICRPEHVGVAVLCVPRLEAVGVLTTHFEREVQTSVV